MVNLQIQMGVM